jgi:hypothetical protein
MIWTKQFHFLLKPVQVILFVLDHMELKLAFPTCIAQSIPNNKNKRASPGPSFLFLVLPSHQIHIYQNCHHQVKITFRFRQSRNPLGNVSSVCRLPQFSPNRTARGCTPPTVRQLVGEEAMLMMTCSCGGRECSDPWGSWYLGSCSWECSDRCPCACPDVGARWVQHPLVLLAAADAACAALSGRSACSTWRSASRHCRVWPLGVRVRPCFSWSRWRLPLLTPDTWSGPPSMMLCCWIHDNSSRVLEASHSRPPIHGQWFPTSVPQTTVRWASWKLSTSGRIYSTAPLIVPELRGQPVY